MLVKQTPPAQLQHDWTRRKIVWRLCVWSGVRRFYGAFPVGQFVDGMISLEAGYLRLAGAGGLGLGGMLSRPVS